MSYKPSIAEIVAKSFVYSILAIGGMIGTLGMSVMVLGGKHTRGEGQKIVAANLWELVNTPYFAVFTIVVLAVSLYSAVKGYVPAWAKYTAYTLVGIALAPITAFYLLDLLAIKLGFKNDPREELKPDITPAQRMKASGEKNT
ncbi:hypothetical protein [Halioxenophilus aromaticivorans]|uniref:Uncharacterized protein n=1 Tax=Halioxenophilus aromaticivorans TaxID=1306992 RepID=A0AAV3TXI0_9ALTE